MERGVEKEFFGAMSCLDGREIPTLLYLMDGVTGFVYRAEGGIIQIYC